MRPSLFQALSTFALAASLLGGMSAAHADGWRWDVSTTPIDPGASLDVYGRHYDDAGNIYAAVTNARNNLYSGIANNLNARLQPEFQKIEGFQSGNAYIKGPVQLNIIPNGTPTPTVSLSTFAVVTTVTAKKSFGPLTGTCTITIDTGSLNLSGNLDVVNGALTNLNVSGFVPSSRTDCSTNVSWIPFIGSLVDSMANNKVEGVVNRALSAAVGASHQTFDPIRFAGLNVAIPAGRYVVKELNFDAGQYVVNNLQYLISSTPVSVRFSAPLPTMYSPHPYVDPATKRIYIQRDEAFSIAFPSAPYGGIRFAVYDRTMFTSRWECRPMKPYCGPPNVD